MEMQLAETSSAQRLRLHFDGGDGEADEIDVEVLQTISKYRAQADADFKMRFTHNQFGFVCSVRDRLWFEREHRIVGRRIRGRRRNEIYGVQHVLQNAR